MKSMLIFRYTLLTILVLCFAAHLNKLNAQNIYDPGFGNSGILTYGAVDNGYDELAVGSVELPDGSVIVAGNVKAGNDSGYFLAKYTPLGMLDNTFYDNGKLIVMGVFVKLYDIAINPVNNSLALAGTIRVAFDYQAWAAYVVIGQLPVGNNFYVSAGENSAFTSIHFTSAGNMVAAGYVVDASGTSSRVCKFDQTLTLLSNFFSDGDYRYPDPIVSKSTCSMLNGDSLYVAGYAPGTIRDSIVLDKFVVEGPSVGTRNLGFPTSTSVFYYFSSINGKAVPEAIRSLPNAEIVIACSVGDPGARDVKLIKFNKEGTLNTLFGGSGEFTFSLGEDAAVADIYYSGIYNGLYAVYNYTIAGVSQVYFAKYNLDATTEAQSSVVDLGGVSGEIATSIVSLPPSNIGLYGNVTTKNKDIFIMAFDEISFTYPIPPGFGSGGVGFTVSEFNTTSEEFTDLKSTPDGQVIALYSTNISNYLIKFDQTGQIVNSFGGLPQDGIEEWPSLLPNDKLQTLDIDPSGNIYVAGTTTSGLGQAIVVSKYTSQGVLDAPAFNSTGTRVFTINDSLFDPLDIKVSNSGKIYVMAKRKQPDGKVYITLVAFNSDGTIDNNFVGTGTGYLVTNIQVSDSKFGQLLLDDSRSHVYICFSGGPSAGRKMHVARILMSNGNLDSNFDGDGYYISNPGANEHFLLGADIDANGNIYLAGMKGIGSVVNGSAIKLNNSGTLITNFGTSGNLNLISDNSNAFVGCKVLNQSLILFSFTNSGLKIARTDLSGTLDISFDGDGNYDGHLINGIQQFSMDYNAATSSFFIGNEKFITGENRDVEIVRFLYTPPANTGTGINPGLSLSDVNKVYGDAPFSMIANSLSPAPIVYTVVSGCLTMDADSNFVITCAGTAVIRATQVATPDFDADQDEATVTIAKATPFLVFNNQGAVVGDAPFIIEYSSNADTSQAVFINSGNNNAVFNLSGKGLVTPLAAGNSSVTIVIPASTNYVGISATALITVYATPVPPEVLPALINATYGDTTLFDLAQILVGKSAPIDFKSIDLDPDADGIQSSVKLPEYGFFEVDTNGVLKFIPNYGFIGEASLDFIVSDKRGIKSEKTSLRIRYELNDQKNVPSLETKEVFTPNGDGLNDTFVIAFLDNTIDNSLVVYDRNGHEVFQVSDYRNDWTGKDQSGKVLDSGV
ncbi:MAG: gliding motility-associated C-terminal domain-containing protein, partial [Cytophagaceae bacterium]|nr:gliding motility-associated C-terminal domain-containing protein [Cytophagaceae bacterium]